MNCATKDCKEKKAFISMISDVNIAEEELIKCEKCCTTLIAPDKHKKATYLEARKKYVQLFWESR